MMVAVVFCSDTPHTHPVALGSVAFCLVALAGLRVFLDRSIDGNMLAVGFVLFLIAIALSPCIMARRCALDGWCPKWRVPKLDIDARYWARLKASSPQTPC
jgi:hypothetical protein